MSQVVANDDGTLGVIHVMVGSCGFDISSEEAGVDQIEEGAWVQFWVSELALFDENL